MKSLQGLHVHFDPVSGIAGDMTVAALVDAGVPASVVAGAVAAVGVPGLAVRFETRKRGAFVGRGFIVDEPGTPKQPGRRTAAPALRGKGADGHRKGRGPQARARAGHEHGHDHEDGHDHEHGHDHDHDHGHEHDHQHEHGQRHQLGPARGRDRDNARRRSQAHSHQVGHGPAPDHAHHHRDYAEIRRLLARAKLDPDAKALAQELFARLAEVEAHLHGTSLERVAFHEVGAFDSIADIVGMAAAVAWLAPVSIGSSAPVVGTGTVRTAHGLVAVPAPATAALLRGFPMVSEGEGELTTPTGAAFLATVVDQFGPPPPVRLVSVGYGAGTRVLPDRANVLRVLLGEPIGLALPAAADEVVVLESNIDDMTGQLLASLSDALFKAGALDVWSTPILMKKGRPAQQISAITEASRITEVERAFFLNSTTLGLRIYPVARRTLARSLGKVQTPFGMVAVKVAALDGEAIGSTPEYEDCRRLATAAGVPVRTVWTEAVAASAFSKAASTNGATSKTAGRPRRKKEKGIARPKSTSLTATAPPAPRAKQSKRVRRSVAKPSSGAVRERQRGTGG